MSALLKASRNDAIIARCLQTISQLIPLTSAVFYRVNNRLKPENYILHNISDNTHQQYLENFQPLDPLLPSHFSHQNTTVAAMTPRLCDRNRHYYHEFMLPNNVRDMTEIFIRRERRIVAGISLMRDVPFSSEERQRAQAVLPLVELAIRDCLQEEDDLPAIKLLAIDIVLEIGRVTNLVFGQALKTSGDAVFPAVIAAVFMFVFAVGGTWLFGISMGLMAVGAYIGLASDECVRAVGMVWRWKTGKWRTKKLV